MDPRVDYRKWLRNTLHAVLDDAIAKNVSENFTTQMNLLFPSDSLSKKEINKLIKQGENLIKSIYNISICSNA